MDIKGQKVIRQRFYIPGYLSQRGYGNIHLTENVKEVGAEYLFRYHLQQLRLCGAYHPDIGMLVFKNVQQYRLFVKRQQLHVFDDDCSAVGFLEISFHAVVYLTAERCRVMLPYKCRASRFDNRAWFLRAGTVEVDLLCNLLLACATFSENYGVGVSGGNSSDGLFYTSERLALPWNKVIGKRQHNLSGLAYLPTVSMSCLSNMAITGNL